MAQRPRWQERQQLARLCDLVADSLLPHLVNKAIRGWDDDEVDDGEQGPRCIKKLHWDPGYQLNAGKVVSIVTDDRHSLSEDSAQFGIVSGSLLQLLCSLVEQSDTEDTDRRDIFVKLADVIPRLGTFLQEQQDTPKSLSQYSKHKILLYMEEDDMLFIILLQLLDAPLISLAIDKMETKWTSELIGAKLFSIVFDPVHIFHQWLSLLHYDHLVLVDYLISKDVGVHCAQYLLRCLRLVSGCWDAFVDDSVYEAQIQKFNCKRQRTLKDINSFTGSSMEGTKLGSSYDKENKSKEQLFLSAKVCLLSLKQTLEDLHKKDLFPYNPKPLLKSLSRFEELCAQY
ncbi:unnamed protein product [Triticum turgidum subsp. durum]|uniref:Protein Lines C-terminal domain-containing protein n=1 Tax=Triticum turgidum subsp. durum TaxID=4567 RepID=A0A9R1PPR2_TRITD|nr:unnamed protein product [Triticum turgidum subsp. durum]